MAKQYLMAVDAGTGSVRAVLFDTKGNQLGCVQREWEHKEDPRWPGSMDFDWAYNWQLASGCIRGVLAETGIDPKEIAAVSTTCMREGIVLYDKDGRYTGTVVNRYDRDGKIIDSVPVYQVKEAAKSQMRKVAKNVQNMFMNAKKQNG